jgi:hypothetical protein
VAFQKLGPLSPQKKVVPSQSPVKNVSFEKLGSLSPIKQVVPSAKDLSDLKAKADRLVQNLSGQTSKLTPQQIKAKLGTVSKLSDLQSKLNSLNSKPVPELSSTSHRRALFAPPSSPGPKLSQNPVTFDIVQVKISLRTYNIVEAAYCDN